MGGYWSQNYAIIFQCNDILTSIEESEASGKLTEEDLRNRGEAMFFRAYCYFNLVRAFGEVPLITFKVNDSSEANVPKTTAENLYKQIDKDLAGAESYCRNSGQQNTWAALPGGPPFAPCTYVHDAQ